MTIITLILSILFFALSVQSQTFTSSDGLRKIVAKITAYEESSEVVSIIRSDGIPFRTKISNFSRKDRAYVLGWKKGTIENFLSVGREYPYHLRLYLELLNSGKIGFNQDSCKGPIVVGIGSSPFLAWVDGYDKLVGKYGSHYRSTSIFYNFNHGGWQAGILIQPNRSSASLQTSDFPITTQLGGLQRARGPILHQPPKIKILNHP